MSYITAAEATQFLFPRGSAPSDLNTFINAELSTVDEIIDRKCGRSFTKGSAGEVRCFDGTGERHLYIDDLITLTRLEIKESWSSVWHEIAPTYYLPIGSPIYKIVLVSRDSTFFYIFPEGKMNVCITGTWGWPSVPPTIKLVAKQILLKLLLRAEQFRAIYYKDSLASEGIPQPQPSTEIWDETMESLIAPYVKRNWSMMK